MDSGLREWLGADADTPAKLEEYLQFLANSFCYEPQVCPLGTIRLLRLLPSELDNTTVGLELFEVALEQAPEFEALSYAWGPPEKHFWPIVINWQYFWISLELKIVLRRLRYRAEKRVLWIDAICINQDDSKEKTEQVQQMRQIYARAKGVVIYLGNDDSEGEYFKAVNLLEQLAAEQRPNVEEEFPDQWGWKALPFLLLSPWFSRTWTVQEMASARDATLVYGASSLPWSSFEKAFELLTSLHIHRQAYGRLARIMGQISNTKESNLVITTEEQMLWMAIRLSPHRTIDLPSSIFEHQHIRLLDLMINTWDRKASDARDKVFALLGLATDAHPKSARVDYCKDKNQVYKEAVADIILREQKLDIITCGVRMSANRQLPTWCPDWTHEQRKYSDEAINFLERSRNAHWVAGGDLPTTVDFSPGFDALLVDGIVLSVVADISLPVKGKEEIFAAFNSVTQDQDATAPGQLNPTNNDILPPESNITIPSLELWQTVSLDTVTPLEPVEGVESYKVLPVSKATYKGFSNLDDDFSDGILELMIAISGYNNISGYLDQFEEDETLSDEHVTGKAYIAKKFPKSTKRGLGGSYEQNVHLESGVSLKIFLHSAVARVGRTLFHTAGGRLGSAPLGVQEGDLVVLLLGSSTPSILRVENERLVLVGSCYIHGIMHGEILPEIEQNLWRITRLEIY